MLASLGVSSQVIGSLAKGSYGQSSDIDFLILDYPPDLKYGIEGRIEDELGGHPFDVVYLDEIPAWKAERFLREAVHARDLL